MEDEKSRRKKTPPLLAPGNCGQRLLLETKSKLGLCFVRFVETEMHEIKKRDKNQNLQGKRQRECSLTKVVASRKKRNCVGKKTDSSDPCSRKLRPDVVGDEKLKTLPKKNQNERTKKGRGGGQTAQGRRKEFSHLRRGRREIARNQTNSADLRARKLRPSRRQASRVATTSSAERSLRQRV